MGRKWKHWPKQTDAKLSHRQRICESDNTYQVIKTKYQHILIARPFIGSIKLLANLRKLKLKHFIGKPIFNSLTFKFFLYDCGAILFTWTIPPCGRKLSSWSCPFALRKKNVCSLQRLPFNKSRIAIICLKNWKLHKSISLQIYKESV